MNQNSPSKTETQLIQFAYILMPSGFEHQAVAGVLPLERLKRTLVDSGVGHVVCVSEDETSSACMSMSMFRESDNPSHSRLILRSDIVVMPDVLDHFVLNTANAVDVISMVSEEKQEPVGLFFVPEGTELDHENDQIEPFFASIHDQADVRYGVQDPDWHNLARDGKRIAERKLSTAVGATPSTLMGRLVGHPVTSRLARMMSRVGIPVVVVQVLAACLLVLSAVLAAPANAQLVTASLVFLVASFFDQAGRDLAALTHRDTHAHGIVSALIRYLGFGAFFGALGLHAYNISGPRFYVFAVLMTTCLWGYLTILMARFASSEGSELAPILDASNLKDARNTSRRWWERGLLSFDWLVRAESFPVFVVFFCALGLSGPLFWMSSVALAGSIISVLRLLSGHEAGPAKAMSRSAATFLFYLVGFTILLVLVSRMPFIDLRQAVSSIGPEMWWLILMPFTWAIPYAFSIWILLDRRVSFRDVVYTQISGDAFNNIIPLMGLGGEPYKAKHLSNFVGLEDASRAVVQSRLIHAVSGVLFTAIVLFLTVAVVDLEAYPKVAFAMGGVAVFMALSFFVLLWVTMSKVPSKAAGFVLTRLNITEDFQETRLSWPKLTAAMTGKMIGRVGKFVELYFIFLLVGITPAFGDVVLVEAMIMASASIFFVVPQGLGVNEAGITAAFNMIGMTSAAGLAYGLIRRARVVGYSLLGLAIFLTGRALSYGHTRYR